MGILYQLIDTVCIDNQIFHSRVLVALFFSCVSQESDEAKGKLTSAARAAEMSHRPAHQHLRTDRHISPA